MTALSQSHNSINAGKSEKSGKYLWIPWAIVGAFMVVVSANGGLIFYALHTWPGLTTDHAYDEGVSYNRTIDQRDIEAQWGWTMTIAYEAGSRPTDGTLLVTVTDRDGKPIADATVSAAVRRPVGDELPTIRLANLVRQPDGRYSSTLQLPEAGQWDVFVTATEGDRTYHNGRRFVAE